MVRCKDCKHSFRSWRDFHVWGSGYEFRCRLNWIDAKIEFDPVAGEKKVPGKFESCHHTRASYSKVCGEEGKLWTPTNSKNFLTYLKRV